MRKFVKLMAITTISTISVLQVTACKDDSRYNTFISDVNKSSRENSAFFGVLGPKNDASNNLQTTFDYLNNKDSGTSLWDIWIENHRAMLDNVNIRDIHLQYYLGRSYDNDPVNEFWNDKNISWQQSIFNWVYTRSQEPGFPEPDGVAEVSAIETKKENDKEMFSTLPIVFIISKGQLKAAGQGWLLSEDRSSNLEAVYNFILSNLLSQ